MASSQLLLLAILQAPAAAQNLPLTNCGVIALHTQPTLYEVTKGSADYLGSGWPLQGTARIIRLKSAKGKRTATCTIRNRINFWPDCPNCSFGKSRVLASFTQIAQRVRMITPLSQLEPGEYWLHRCSTEQSGPLSDALFGIRVGEP